MTKTKLREENKELYNLINKKYSIGRFINKGYYKHVYLSRKDPTKVILILKSYRLKSELENYEKMKRLHLRVPVIYEHYTCEMDSVVIMERLYYLTEDEKGSETLLVDILFALEYLRENKIWINDLQFLVNEERKPTFIDPLSVRTVTWPRDTTNADYRREKDGLWNEFTIDLNLCDIYLDRLKKGNHPLGR